MNKPIVNSKGVLESSCRPILGVGEDHDSIYFITRNKGVRGEKLWDFQLDCCMNGFKPI